MKLSCCESIVPGASMEEKLDNLEKFGYQGIEIGGRDALERLTQLRRALANSPIEVSAVLGQLGGALLHPDKAERERILGLIEQRLEAVRELGAGGAILVPIFGPPQMPDLTPYASRLELERELFLRLLEDIAKRAERIGATIFIEPLNRYETHFINRLEQAAEFCAKLDSPRVKFLADAFHMNIEEIDPARSIRENTRFLGHVHLADSTRLVPGLGQLDFAPIFEALGAAGYDGWCSLECGIRGDAAAELVMAREHLVKAGLSKLG